MYLVEYLHWSFTLHIFTSHTSFRIHVRKLWDTSIILNYFSSINSWRRAGWKIQILIFSRNQKFFFTSYLTSTSFLKIIYTCMVLFINTFNNIKSKWIGISILLLHWFHNVLPFKHEFEFWIFFYGDIQFLKFDV